MQCDVCIPQLHHLLIPVALCYFSLQFTYTLLYGCYFSFPYSAYIRVIASCCALREIVLRIHAKIASLDWNVACLADACPMTNFTC